MFVTNPTEQDLEIEYKGDAYKIGAKKTEEMGVEVATFWKKDIHNFLIVTDAKEQPKEVTKPSKKATQAVVEEKVEEVVIETVTTTEETPDLKSEETVLDGVVKEETVTDVVVKDTAETTNAK
jgi:hypothetical protein